MSPGYQRPEGGWRAHFQGVKTNAPADSLEATKSPFSKNIRSTKNQTVQTRPGYIQLLSTIYSIITDIRAYSTLGTDNQPRFLARNNINQIYLDNAALVGTLAGSSLGAFMIPFRPNASPQSWMYIAAQEDYKKYSAPSSSNAVTEYNVGLREPQTPPDACAESFALYQFTGLAANWAQSGTAGAPTDGDRLAATNIGAIFADPASGSDVRYSLEVSSVDSYQPEMIVVIDKLGDDLDCVVQDVLPPINGGANLIVDNIYYYQGTTGRCVISASQFAANATAPIFDKGQPKSSSIYADSVIASLRRSAIIQISHDAGTYTDDFDRADSDDLGPNWTEYEQASGDIKIVTDRVALKNTAAPSMALYTAAGPFTNNTVQMTYKTRSDDSFWAAGVCTYGHATSHADASGYTFTVGRTFSRRQIEIGRIDAGAFTSLGTAFYDVNDDDVLKLTVTTVSHLRVDVAAYINDVLKLTASDTSGFVIPNGGYGGIVSIAGAGTTTAYFDDWSLRVSGSFEEKCFVLSTTTGPDGSICFEVDTTNTFISGDVLTGIGAIVVTGANGVAENDTIEAADITAALTGAGTGKLSQALSSNPFEQLLDPTSSVPQQDDYIGIGININNLSRFTIGKLVFNVGSTVDYATDAFYVQFTPNDLVFHPPAETQVTITTGGEVLDTSGLDGNIQSPPETVTTTVPLPSNQWTTLFFPIRSLVRIGNDLTKTLANCNGVQVTFEATDSITVAIAGLFIGGSGHPDVGTNPAYFYIVRGRSTLTNTKSNPSPSTRYSVSPRRQQVLVTAVDTVLDPQMDVWDVFRFGGTVSSWRYVGTMPNSQGGSDTFVDDFFDTSVIAGDLLEYDNFQPWPSIDVPFNLTAGTVLGITLSLTIIGTTIQIVWSSATTFTDPAPSTILNWLPGTLINIGGQTAFTLWTRPTAITLASPPNTHYYAYLLQLVEDAGSSSPTTLSILEPNVANQRLPYVFGPDAEGTIFACGDPLRPGSIYFAKSNSPDSAPDTYNQELTPPSEPLLGGDVINGVSIVASSSRWWKLYPNFGSNNRYQAVEMPVGRGLVAPYAHCTDGRSEYFVAKDGIWVTAGGSGVSLTDADLYNLFPHEGANTPVDYVYATYTIYAPDYKYAGDFRLAYCNSYLYFDYRDSSGFARTLVADLRDTDHIAWCPDFYGTSITRHYAVEQQESTVLTAGERYPLLLLGDSDGNIHTQTLNSNDNGVAIDGVYGTFEYNGGDIRSDQLFNDAFLDFIPVSGIQVAPVSEGTAVQAATSIGASSSRIQTNIPIGQELKYLGVVMAWTDNFTTQAIPTEIDAWQPMYQGVPVSVFQWKTQGTTFGWKAYGHLRQWNFAYRSTDNVTITITARDGTSPDPIILPSTGGLVKKTMFPFTFNKGMIYFFLASSPAEWTPYLSESELLTGEWGRTDPYIPVHDIEAPKGIRS